MSANTILAAKKRPTKAERIARYLALATKENAQLGLPEPYRLNGIWLDPLGAGRVKPIGSAPWRRPKQ
jgi:hypothetical protein